MPKTYSNQERKIITEELQKAALNCMKQYGIRKTTVNELVKRANIPKGTFYLFYESKERLLYDVIMKFHNQIQNEFLEKMKLQAKNMSVKKLTDVLYDISLKTMDSGMATIMASEEIKVLMRKISPDLVKKHLEQDKNMIAELIKMVPLAKGKDKEVFSTALEGAFMVIMARDSLGDKFEEAFRLIIRGIVLQFLEQ